VKRDGARRVRAPAPAKLNLGLRITGRRPDGTHELESVFVPLDLADRVAVEVSDAAAPSVTLALDREVQEALGDVPADRRNLAVRAAERFLDAAGLACAVEIRLAKRIPVAAGLGGGSSDAGTVLRGLADLFPGALEATALAGIARGLGADVPFFLDPRPARVRGIGERIEPLTGLPALSLLLANPGIPLPTADVYQAFDALGARPSAGAEEGRRARLGPLLGGGRDAPPDPAFFRALDRSLENDLEPAAVRLCPPVARLRDRLRALGAPAVGMSGSGPTVFGAFEGPAAARAALERAAFEPPIWARVAVVLESR
jgi:4-diphosphocytidyl-2-C-methyl-D-erythritol kinase